MGEKTVHLGNDRKSVTTGNPDGSKTERIIHVHSLGFDQTIEAIYRHNSDGTTTTIYEQKK
jgi:hypothetical protein